MKRDPTKLVLRFFTAFYGIVAAARWYFVVHPAYLPTEHHLSWVGILGNVMGLAICVFLLSDAPGRPSRAFWMIEAVSSVFRLGFRIGLFWSLPNHGDLLAAGHFTLLCMASLGFLVWQAGSLFSLFGSRTIRMLREGSTEQHARQVASEAALRASPDEPSP